MLEEIFGGIESEREHEAQHLENINDFVFKLLANHAFRDHQEISRGYSLLHLYRDLKEGIFLLEKNERTTADLRYIRQGQEIFSIVELWVGTDNPYVAPRYRRKKKKQILLDAFIRHMNKVLITDEHVETLRIYCGDRQAGRMLERKGCRPSIIAYYPSRTKTLVETVANVFYQLSFSTDHYVLTSEKTNPS